MLKTKLEHIYGSQEKHDLQIVKISLDTNLEFSEKEAIENALKDVEEAMKSDDKDTIEAKTNALTEAAQKLGEKVYADQQAQANTESAQQPQGEKTVDAEVVDAEFEEVKKD